MSSEQTPVLTPVPSLPWYETLRTILEPYRPAKSEADADKYFTSQEIIANIEQHHGVPQGPIGKEIQTLVYPTDFVRAMKYLGYQCANAGGVAIHWLMKRA